MDEGDVALCVVVVLEVATMEGGMAIQEGEEDGECLAVLHMAKLLWEKQCQATTKTV